MACRSVSRLAAVLAGAAAVSGCMEAPSNDGRMFQRWAEAVASIPTSDEEAYARAGRPAPSASGAPAPVRVSAPQVTMTAEAAGLRAPIRIAVVDPLEMPHARDLGLRDAIDMVAGDTAARMQRAAYRQPLAAPPAAAGGPAVQLGAFRSRAAAEAAWATLRARHGDVLAGIVPRFETADLGARGTWVRLKATAPNSAAAQQLCRAAGADPWCARSAG